MRDQRERREWEAWQKIVKLSEESGAITRKDWETAVGKPAETPGVKLIIAIKEWGEALVSLRSEL